MKLRSGFVGIFALGAVCAQAQVVNGGFESGLTGWSSAGVTQSADASIGTNPYEGSFQALATSMTDSASGSSEAGLDSALGLGSGAIGAAGGQSVVYGSAVYQTFHLSAGANVSFAYDFLTNQVYNDGSFMIAPDASNDDFVFFAVIHNGASVTKLADVFDGYSAGPGSNFSTNFVPASASNPFLSELGYRTASFQASDAGDYTLAIGVAHASSGPDNGVSSAVLIDGVAATPEPASLIAFGGLAAAFLARRKKSS